METRDVTSSPETPFQKKPPLKSQQRNTKVRKSQEKKREEERRKREEERRKREEEKPSSRDPKLSSALIPHTNHDSTPNIKESHGFLSHTSFVYAVGQEDKRRIRGR